MIEKRKQQREEAFLVGEVEGDIVYIGDISDGGIKIASSEDIGSEGKIITVHLKFPTNVLKEIDIRGRIVWRREVNGVYFFGIEFLNYNEISDHIRYIKELNEFITEMRKNLLS